MRNPYNRKAGWTKHNAGQTKWLVMGQRSWIGQTLAGQDRRRSRTGQMVGEDRETGQGKESGQDM